MYQQARQIDYADTLHGVVIPDPYKWMEDLKSKEVLDYVKADADELDRAIRGNPDIKEEFESMIEYSPYQNVKKQNYPPMLFTIGLKDRNVPAYQSLKMVAKIKSNNIGKAPIYLSTDLKGDHYRLNPKRLTDFMFILGIHYNILP
jgi:protease II